MIKVFDLVQVVVARNPRHHRVGDTLQVKEIRGNRIVTCDGDGGFVTYNIDEVKLWQRSVTCMGC